MPKSIRYVQPSAEYLRTQFSGKRSSSALGRAVLSKNVLTAAAKLNQLSDRLAVAQATDLPRIDYLHKNWFADIASKGVPSNTLPLGIEDISHLPERMRTAEDIYEALLQSPLLDKATACAAMTLQVAGVTYERNYKREHTAFNLGVAVFDIPHGLYNDGYTLRGENELLGHVYTRSFKQKALPSDGTSPQFIIRLAEIETTDHPELQLSAGDVMDAIAASVHKTIGTQVELSPIQVIEIP